MMSVNDKSVFVMALVLVALMSIFVPVASAGESQTWYLHNDLSLDKTGPGTGSYSLPAVTTTGWTAGPAQCGLTMGAGTWTLSLDYDAPYDGELQTGIVNDEGGEMMGYMAIPISEGTHSIDQEITGSSVDFETGQHLQLRLRWAGSGSLEVECDSNAILTSPSTDPGYPVPELSSLILFSVGLLALAGYVVYRRRK